MTREQHVVIRQALAQIPPKFREPLILFYREQQSTKEVAGQLGLSENAARQRISRGRSMLRGQVTGMVESAIARTKPSKAFKTAVIAAIAASAGKTTTTATAAGLLSTLAGKATVAAAGIALVVGAVLVHKHITPPEIPVVASEAVESTMLAPSDPEVAAHADNGDIGTAERDSGGPAALVRAEMQPDDQHQGGAPAEDPSPPPNVSQPAAAQSQGVLSGVITDSETSEPIPDALVRIAGNQGRGRHIRATTDSEGFYRFDQVYQAGDFDLWVDTLTHVGVQRSREHPVVNLSNDKQVVQNLSLPRACTVDVWVVDQNGVGIPDAVVVTTSLADDGFGPLGTFANRRRTDPNGYVLLGGIPAGESDYLVTAWHRVEGDGAESDGALPRRRYDSVPGKAVVRLADPNVISEVTVVLAKGQSVVGYAEYADGVPAAEVKLSPSPQWWRCSHAVDSYKTDNEGIFTFDHIVPGAYNIAWDMPIGGGGGAVISRTIMQAKLPPAAGEPLVVRLPQNAPHALVSIRGIVTVRGERASDDIGITASSAAGAYVRAQARLQPDGSARFEVKDVAPGVYDLAFSGPNLEDRIVRDVVAPTDELAVEMVYAPQPIVIGTVLDSGTGQPIERFRTRVRQVRPLRDSMGVQRDEWIRFDDPQGRFSLEMVGPGVYEVQVQAEGYAPRWSDPINTDESFEIQFALTAGGTITGKVVDENGKPVSNATVIPLSQACGVMLGSENAFVSQEGAVRTTDGVFRLTHLPAGLETLKVNHPDYAPEVVEEISVSEGKSTDGIQIVLSEGATVEGYVYDADGQPQAGETLVFQDGAVAPDPRLEEAYRLASVATDRNGFYRVMHLPEKPCYVRRGSRQQPLGVIQQIMLPSADHATRVDLGGTPIVTGVVILDGAAQANRYLRLHPSNPQDIHSFSCYAMTDTEGEFAFAGVVPGTHSISHQLPGKRPLWEEIATVEVGNDDVNLDVIPAGKQ